MIIRLLTLLVSIQLAAAQAVPAPPRAEIANGQIAATVLLPDAKAGYYRGTRFDWSGVVERLTVGGHEYFGQWFEKYDPELHDAIMGPVEEFLTGDSSLGYAEAAVGGTFVRIGVGTVRKPVEERYQRFKTYEIVDPGTWTIEKGPDRVTFVHVLKTADGYAYEYRKVLRLDGASLHLDHRLRNTGTKAIATSVYNHNFFTLDRQVTGPDIRVRFPFTLQPARDMADRAKAQGSEIVYLKTLAPGETAYTELAGFGATASDYDIRLEHHGTGAGVRMTGDRPIQKIVFWSAVKTVCPEPYIDVSVAPGQESTWRNSYAFYDVKSQPKAALR